MLVLAQVAACRLNQTTLGTLHILLGLIEEGDGIGARALGSLGITVEIVLQEKGERIAAAESEAAEPGGSHPYTLRWEKVLELSVHEAFLSGDEWVDTGDLLVGLVRQNQGAAANVLSDHGADLQRVRRETARLREVAGSAVSDQDGSDLQMVRQEIARLREVAGSAMSDQGSAGMPKSITGPHQIGDAVQQDLVQYDLGGVQRARAPSHHRPPSRNP